MKPVFLLCLIELFAVCCMSSDKKSYPNQDNEHLNKYNNLNDLEMKKEIENLQLAGEYLTADVEALWNELNKERIRIENLENENKILRESAKPKHHKMEDRYRDRYSCSICLEDFTDSSFFACVADDDYHIVCSQCHVYHVHCLKENLSKFGRKVCPTCNTECTKIADFPHPFKANKEDPKWIFKQLYKGLLDNNETISMSKAITAISPFVTVPKGIDWNDAVYEIMPPWKEFKVSDFQNFIDLLQQVGEKDGNNLYLRQGVLLKYLLTKYFQNEIGNGIHNNNKRVMIVEPLQKEMRHGFQNEVDARAICFWKNAEIAVSEPLIILSLATLLFVSPFVIDKLAGTTIEAFFEKRGFFEALIGTAGFAVGMLLYTAIGKPVIRALRWLIVQIATDLRNYYEKN